MHKVWLCIISQRSAQPGCAICSMSLAQPTSSANLEILHKEPLKLNRSLLACTEISSAEESDMDGQIEVWMLDHAELRTQKMRFKKAGLRHSHADIASNQR